MSVRSITAYVDCDEYDIHFSVNLDPARSLPSDWSLWDEAEDAVRGGIDSSFGILESTSVQDGKMLCPRCTHEVDTCS